MNRLTILYTILIIAPLLLSMNWVATEKYVVDTKESVVVYNGSMQFTQNSHNGYVYLSKGELLIEKGQLSGGNVEVDMNTIEDHNHDRNNNLIDHLKSSDFFDVEKFPISAFTITKVTSSTDDKISVTGDMTIKGITHEVTFPATIKVDAGVAKANGKLTIDRTKWDVRYGSGKFFSGLADKTLSDNIELEMKIVARKK